MTVLDEILPPQPPPPPDSDVPRVIDPGIAGADRRFKRIATANGAAVLILTGAIGLLLALASIPAIRHYGLKFFTTAQFDIYEDKFGILGAIVGTIVVAVIALGVAFPLAFGTAIYITEYAPRRAKALMVSVIDLMAAVPSLIYGAWGVAALMPHALYVDRWIARYLGWIPIFKVPVASPTSVPFDGITATQFEASPFIAGLVVAMMVVPLSCAVMRNVFSQAPAGEREAALALGSTRWGMIRTVVIPFGRGGIIGGTMLGLGRALGETVAVLFVLNIAFGVQVRPLQRGGVTISQLIANYFGEATGVQRYGLLAAGFVLFLMTLVVNTIAARVVTRSRSGAGLDA